jgi:hypothetical protein
MYYLNVGISGQWAGLRPGGKTMETKWKVTILTLVIALPAFMLGAGTPMGEPMWQAIWPFQGDMMAAPAGGQVPLFMFIGALEALGFGLAISLLVFGLPIAHRTTTGSKAMATWVIIAIAWLMGNWWVHTSLHIVNGHSVSGLLLIEYLFHVTLVAAGIFLAWAFSRGMLRTQAATAA